jgi:hypothetical protein
METCRHCEERKRQSNPHLFEKTAGLLREACHRRAFRAIRWLAMTKLLQASPLA